MEYSVQELSRLSGVTPRTLRWYDEIGLLKPGRVAESGYRYYGEAQVGRLQDILYYRELGIELARIREMLDDPAYDRLTALRSHLQGLTQKRDALDRVIASMQATISAWERNEVMSDEKKFEAFKKRAIEENERAYGKELRDRYGDAEIDASNAAAMKITREQYAQWSAWGGGDPRTALRRRERGNRSGQRGGQGDRHAAQEVADGRRPRLRRREAQGNCGAVCDGRALYGVLRQGGQRLRAVPARRSAVLGEVQPA